MKILSINNITPTLVHLQIKREGAELINTLYRAAVGIAFVSPKAGGRADVVVETRSEEDFLEKLRALNELLEKRFGKEAQ